MMRFGNSRWRRWHCSIMVKRLDTSTVTTIPRFLHGVVVEVGLAHHHHRAQHHHHPECHEVVDY
jgi:hypothetical protein